MNLISSVCMQDCYLYARLLFVRNHSITDVNYQVSLTRMLLPYHFLDLAPLP